MNVNTLLIFALVVTGAIGFGAPALAGAAPAGANAATPRALSLTA